MVEIICFMFPALFSVFALERLLGKKLNLRNFSFVLITNTLIINIASLFLIYVLSGSATMPLILTTGIKVSYFLSYLVISSIITCLVVFAERFYFHRLRIHVSEVKKDEVSDNDEDNSKR